MALYVHGFKQVSLDDTPYVSLTTPIAIDTTLVKQFTDSEDVHNVDPEVTLYRLVEVGPLRDGLDEEPEA